MYLLNSMPLHIQIIQIETGKIEIEAGKKKRLLHNNPVSDFRSLKNFE